MTEVIAFKVLQDMRSCNGGDLVWELGEWYTIKGGLSLCVRGLHLTVNPWEWSGNQVFFAEGKGVAAYDPSKCVCRSVRLLAPAPKPIVEEYRQKWKPIDEEYRQKRKPIEEEYWQKRKPIEEEYWQKQLALIAMLYQKVRQEPEKLGK